MGSIPAHAGEPGSGQTRQSPRRVYPRARGGTKFLPITIEAYKGLSPRTRGNQKSRLPKEAAIGSIPAHAGEP